MKEQKKRSVDKLDKFQEYMHVDLAVMKSVEVEERWKQSERTYHLALKHEAKEFMEIEDIATADDRLFSLPTNGLSYLSSKILNSKSRKINYVDLTDCCLTDNDVIQLSPCMIYIAALDLKYNRNIGAAGMEAISTVINDAKATSQEFRLQILDISNCDLTNDDVIQLSPCVIHLTELYLSGNDKIGAAGMEAISTVINNAKATSQEFRLQILDISNCDLTNDDVIQLSPCVIHLTELYLSGNDKIGAAGMEAISTVINNAKATSQEFRLQILDISNCDLTNDDVIQLSPCIIYLAELNLCGNDKISDVGMYAISTVINDAKATSQEFRLQILDISNCDLTNDDVIYLSPCIIYLTRLDLSGNHEISDLGMEAISIVINDAKATSQEFRLQILDISNCDLTNDDVIYLSPCIIYLAELYLSGNDKISDVGMYAISTVINDAKATSQEFRLQILDISNCDLTNEDVIQLSPCIIYLTRLDLSGNHEISDVGMYAISTVINDAKARSQEFRLQILDISNCDLTNEDVIQLSPCIIYLTRLDLSGNHEISDVGMYAISTVINDAKATSQEFRLQILDISNCDLTNDDVIQLSPCIIYLTRLNLSGNPRIDAAVISTVINNAKATLNILGL